MDLADHVFRSRGDPRFPNSCQKCGRTREVHPDVDETEAIHGWFELTYSNYLVLPRSVLQSMPDEWQQRFVVCLREMEEAFGHLDWPSYYVRAYKREPELIKPEVDCEECDGSGIDLEAQDGDCTFCAGLGRVETGEQRYETADEIGFKEDPIPSYNRGRTRLEPRVSA